MQGLTHLVLNGKGLGAFPSAKDPEVSFPTARSVRGDLTPYEEILTEGFISKEEKWSKDRSRERRISLVHQPNRPGGLLKNRPPRPEKG